MFFHSKILIKFKSCLHIAQHERPCRLNFVRFLLKCRDFVFLSTKGYNILNEGVNMATTRRYVTRGKVYKFFSYQEEGVLRIKCVKFEEDIGEEEYFITAVHIDGDLMNYAENQILELLKNKSRSFTDLRNCLYSLGYQEASKWLLSSPNPKKVSSSVSSGSTSSIVAAVTTTTATTSGTEEVKSLVGSTAAMAAALVTEPLRRSRTYAIKTEQGDEKICLRWVVQEGEPKRLRLYCDDAPSIQASFLVAEANIYEGPRPRFVKRGQPCQLRSKLGDEIFRCLNAGSLEDLERVLTSINDGAEGIKRLLDILQSSRRPSTIAPPATRASISSTSSSSSSSSSRADIDRRAKTPTATFSCVNTMWGDTPTTTAFWVWQPQVNRPRLWSQR